MHTTHLIAGPDSLQQSLWLRRGTHITLALPSFSIVQQENLEARFNRQLARSGNEFCTLAIIAALVGCILFDASRWSFFSVHPVTMLVANLLVVSAAALSGKTLGYLHARWQLARLIWAVADRLATLEENATQLTFPTGARGELFAMSGRSTTAPGRAVFY